MFGARRVSVGARTVGVLAALSVVASCGGGSDTGGGDESSGTIKLSVAAPPVDTCSTPLFVARDKGFFEDAGLDVDIRNIPSGAAIASGVAGGSLDVGCSSPGSLASAYLKGVPFQLIAPAALYSSQAPTTLLLVGSDSTIASAEDLNGKTVGVNALKNVTELGARAWIEKNGGDPETIKFLELPFPQMGAALAAGRVDAAVVAEPAMTAALESGEAKVLSPVFDAISDRFLVTAYFTTKNWVSGNKEAVKRFREAMTRAADFANKNPDETAPILSAFTKVPVAVISKITRAEYATTLDEEEIQVELDVETKYGNLDRRLPAKDLIAAQ